MRVLQIMAGNGNGGAELYSTDIMLSLHSAGLDQCVVMRPTAPRFSELAGAGLRMAPEVLRLPIRPWQRLRMQRLIAREKPDIIHCWMRRAVSLVPPQAAPVIIGWYGDYEEQEKHFPHCTHFIGVTEDLVRHAYAHGAKPGRAFYVPTFPSVDDAPALDRATLRTPPEARVLLTLSRLHKVKGLDTALQALAQLPGCYLWIAGDGPEEAALKALAAELGVAERVRFLGWRTDRGALLRGADICLLPSRYEPFGTVILDSWSTATPFIACESDGPRAYIRDRENGMLVQADDPSALAGAIRVVLDDESLRQRIAANGHAECLAGFTRDVVTRRMIETYEKILGGKNAD
jgi:glycosyltransferase involved in cell wall biosynthesis